LGRAYVFAEKYPDAISTLTEGLTHSTIRPPSTLAYMAIAYFKMNNTNKSNELIQELKERVNRGEKGINIFIAIYYSAINSKEDAFSYLDQSLTTNDVDLVWLKQEPSFVNLRDDTRYNMYLKRTGF
jgi:tetratricopeptide (TPR) repeat protein